VRSLVVAEPPAFAVAVYEPAVARLQADLEPLFAEAMGDRAFLEEFLATVGTPVEELPSTLLAEWEQLVPAIRRGTSMWDVAVPVRALADAPFRTVTVSGAHHPAFTAMCEQLAQAVGGEHVVLPGAGHEVQEAPGFTDLLRRVWAGEPAATPAGRCRDRSRGESVLRHPARSLPTMWGHRRGEPVHRHPAHSFPATAPRSRVSGDLDRSHPADRKPGSQAACVRFSAMSSTRLLRLPRVAAGMRMRSAGWDSATVR
jgi:hypothetical protein